MLPTALVDRIKSFESVAEQGASHRSELPERCRGNAARKTGHVSSSAFRVWGADFERVVFGGISRREHARARQVELATQQILADWSDHGGVRYRFARFTRRRSTQGPAALAADHNAQKLPGIDALENHPRASSTEVVDAGVCHANGERIVVRQHKDGPICIRGEPIERKFHSSTP
jgi:hypothetical protein